jgi:tetratricopeptide (TPR) repeat protein
MKPFCKILLCLVFIIGYTSAFAQNSDDAQSLIKEAVKFNKDGKYTEAIDKYTQALKIDSNNIYANYGIAYSLFAADREKEGIPHLQKVVAAGSSLTATAYDLLGSIYDKDHQSAKAIEALDAGIKADPKYQHLYYNLSLVYFRDKNYPEAEKSAIEAIKLDPKQASSLRVYALVCFHQNKRANALLGLCSFILLEPQTPRSQEAYGNILHILLGGTLKPAPSETAPMATDANSIALNKAITQAVTEASTKKYATQADLSAAELASIFNAVSPLADKQNPDAFFTKYCADYFYKLAQSPNMPAFARMINQAEPENAKWINDHPQYMNDLYLWMKTTERNF